MKPLVSIIIVSHNQVTHLEQAVHSALDQSYQNTEIIGVDDHSSDGTNELWLQLSVKYPRIKYLPRIAHQGYCKTFNRGFAMAHGKYIIDLSADDILLQERVAIGVDSLEQAPDEYGVHFTDAHYINERGEMISGYYKRNRKGLLKTQVPHGNIYQDLLERYFICTPSMMIKKQVLDTLGGYDERLYYEDLDFWIRSSRNYKYAFTDQVLVQKRVLANSMAKGQYRPGSSMLTSTYQVCEKALQLNRSNSEHKALATRIGYELRQCIFLNEYNLASQYLELIDQLPSVPWYYQLAKRLVALKWNWTFLRRMMKPAK
ncbi:MAG: glycosyltransferase family 2 protein [Cyclobacteriaceae bacterium]